jgi:hypothetical protein
VGIETSSPYYSTAIAAANTYGIPQNLFIAQITQESSWNPNAQNGNAIGIAQFMPATAADLGVNPLDPTSALYGAAKYDKQLYSQYGSWQQAMSAYGTTANGNGADVAAIAASADSGSSGWFGTTNPATGKPYTVGDYLGALWSGATSPFSTLFGGSDTQSQLKKDALATGQSITDVTTGLQNLLAIVTDLPRLSTIIIGIIMFGAGLYMLGVAPVVKIVEQSKDAIKP